MKKDKERKETIYRNTKEQNPTEKGKERRKILSPTISRNILVRVSIVKEKQ